MSWRSESPLRWDSELTLVLVPLLPKPPITASWLAKDRFAFDEVVDGITRKLIRRHPRIPSMAISMASPMRRSWPKRRSSSAGKN